MSFPSSVSRPQSNASEWVSTQIARSMVWSDFGLSCFDYPLDRKNRDTVCTLLTDLPFKIVALWVVGRPVNGYTNSKFEHWCVKIQAPPALISIDFLESKKKGAFGLQQTTATDAELEDFLHYFVRNENGKIKKKWHIISSVTPSPLKNTSYLKFIDDHDLKKLKAFMKKNNNKHNTNSEQLVKHININRKICDIADFLGMWTESQTQMRKSSFNPKKNTNDTITIEKTYNPITGNCQQFAADLFQYLVGHKKEYSFKVKEVQLKVQSPYDKKRYKVKEIQSDLEIPESKSPNNEQDNNGQDNNEDNDQKQQIIEEEDDHLDLKTAARKSNIKNKKLEKLNNPQTNLIIHSD
eukprot:236680_1